MYAQLSTKWHFSVVLSWMKYCSNAIWPKRTWIEKIRLKLFTHLTHSFMIRTTSKKICWRRMYINGLKCSTTDHTKYTRLLCVLNHHFYKFDKINMVSLLWLVHWFGRKRAGLLVKVKDVKRWIKVLDSRSCYFFHNYYNLAYQHWCWDGMVSSWSH